MFAIIPSRMAAISSLSPASPAAISMGLLKSPSSSSTVCASTFFRRYRGSSARTGYFFTRDVYSLSDNAERSSSS